MEEEEGETKLKLETASKGVECNDEGGEIVDSIAALSDPSTAIGSDSLKRGKSK